MCVQLINRTRAPEKCSAVPPVAGILDPRRGLLLILGKLRLLFLSSFSLFFYRCRLDRQQSWPRIYALNVSAITSYRLGGSGTSGSSSPLKRGIIFGQGGAKIDIHGEGIAVNNHCLYYSLLDLGNNNLSSWVMHYSTMNLLFFLNYC